MTQAQSTGVEVDTQEAQRDPTAGGAQTVAMPGLHHHLTQVTLLDHTDRRNQLVSTRAWQLHPLDAESLKLQGNLFIVESPFTESGKVFVKCAPLPNARQLADDQIDFEVKNRKLEGLDCSSHQFEFILHQSGPADLESWQVLDYAGGHAGCTRALHRWQQSLRPERARHHTVTFMSNTWGDRNRDACISHDFMMQEIEAGVRLGVEVIMIDDGWQKGRSANSAEAAEKGGVWKGFWSANPEFWDPDPERFPHGLEPLVEFAESKGVELGLWYANDSHDGFTNWKKDAEQILQLHKRYRVKHFKLDAIDASSHAAMRNLRAMIDLILERSNGEIVCDLDITAGVRPGYFGEMTLGVLYVENRYTDWHNYWPHFTLRNLWQLSQYIDPRRMRFELLNNARNTHKYEGDPLAPAFYPPATLFATVMFANPLGFFENSRLPDAYVAEMAELVAIWKAHRDGMLAGDILPIGDTPDGVAWTGFCSCREDSDTGYALVLNEANPSPRRTITLPEEFADIDVIAGDGEATIEGSALTAEIPKPFHFVLAKLRR